EIYLHELWRVGYAGGATSKHQLLEAQSTFNFRLVEVLMMLVLPLLAVALAVPPKRSASGVGIFVAILTVVAYHKINQYAQAAATDGQFNPLIALWTPLLVFSAMIAWMYHVLAHRPGGQPIGALEMAAARVARLLRGLLPKARAA
ncbi:MAG: LptF/LptG family permease, partial [Sphingomicrobium sp.]